MTEATDRILQLKKSSIEIRKATAKINDFIAQIQETYEMSSYQTAVSARESLYWNSVNFINSNVGCFVSNFLRNRDWRHLSPEDEEILCNYIAAKNRLGELNTSSKRELEGVLPGGLNGGAGCAGGIVWGAA